MAVMNTVTANAAFVYSLILSATFELQGLIVMSSMVPLLFILMSYFLPESPLWLMKRFYFLKFFHV